MSSKKNYKEIYFPDDIEYNYSIELKKITKVMEKKMLKLIKQKKNDDSVDDYKDEFMEYMKDYLSNEFCLGIAVDYTTQTVSYAVDQTNRQVKRIKGISFKEQAFYNEEVIKEQIKEQVKLIKAAPGKYCRSFDKEVEKLVKNAVEEGLSNQTLSKAIRLATGVEERRANLIARDQVGKVFGKATKAQHEGIGLKTFEWVTVGDNRVRAEHKDRAGEIYEWSNPPNGEIPGTPIGCRCIASVVKSEVLNL